MIIHMLTRIAAAKPVPAAIARFFRELTNDACSKMPGGEGIVAFLFAGYLACAVLVFIIAISSAAVRARKAGSNPTRIWTVHLLAAIVVTTALPVFLVVDQQRALRSIARSQQQLVDLNASIERIELSPGHVRQALDGVIRKFPPANQFTDAPEQKLEKKVLERLSASDIEWTPEDLDAFDSIAAQTRSSLPAIVAWNRQRADLAAARSLCDEPARPSNCKQELASAMSYWCTRNNAACDTLFLQADFRDAAASLGVRQSVPDTGRTNIPVDWQERRLRLGANQDCIDGMVVERTLASATRNGVPVTENRTRQVIEDSKPVPCRDGHRLQ
jgi:hypothetical protein